MADRKALAATLTSMREQAHVRSVQDASKALRKAAEHGLTEEDCTALGISAAVRAVWNADQLKLSRNAEAIRSWEAGKAVPDDPVVLYFYVRHVLNCHDEGRISKLVHCAYPRAASYRDPDSGPMPGQEAGATSPQVVPSPSAPYDVPTVAAIERFLLRLAAAAPGSVEGAVSTGRLGSSSEGSYASLALTDGLRMMIESVRTNNGSRQRPVDVSIDPELLGPDGKAALLDTFAAAVDSGWRVWQTLPPGTSESHAVFERLLNSVALARCCKGFVPDAYTCWTADPATRRTWLHAAVAPGHKAVVAMCSEARREVLTRCVVCSERAQVDALADHLVAQRGADAAAFEILPQDAFDERLLEAERTTTRREMVKGGPPSWVAPDWVRRRREERAGERFPSQGARRAIATAGKPARDIAWREPLVRFAREGLPFRDDTLWQRAGIEFLPEERTAVLRSWLDSWQKPYEARIPDLQHDSPRPVWSDSVFYAICDNAVFLQCWVTPPQSCDGAGPVNVNRQGWREMRIVLPGRLFVEGFRAHFNRLWQISGPTEDARTFIARILQGAPTDGTEATLGG